MAKSATRVKATAQIYVPQTREDAAGDIKTIGDLNREVARLEAEMNDKIAEITESYKNALKPFLTGCNIGAKQIVTKSPTAAKPKPPIW